MVYAAEELAKYLKLMSGSPVETEIGHGTGATEVEADGQGVIRIGTGADLGIPFDWAGSGSAFDDALHIDVRGGEGVVAGINPRSVLLGVYRMLTESGCRWVRPGKDGELIPRKRVEDIAVRLREQPSYRHRGVCFDGASSRENVLDMIEWLPKLGFNAYFIQYRDAYIFYDYWYSHKNNPFKTPEPLLPERAGQYTAEAAAEIKKRDLIYHAVGHGWTCEPLGIPVTSWEPADYEVAPEYADYLAEIQGKRHIWGGIPAITNLCYSNPRVRELIVRDVVEYAAAHPEIDVLHFWLADESNNQCECANCRATIPSDDYVRMLNAIDARLTLLGAGTKIVFLMYADLLWAPRTETIRNESRFILIFAPITRTFSVSYRTDGWGDPPPALPEYERNRLKFPSTIAENFSFLRAWQQHFAGDAFDFDYHFVWDHYLDPGAFRCAEILSEDIKALSGTGLNGLMSCQVQRAFFPTGFGMHVLGRTLWDSKLEFQALADLYFADVFGKDGLLCKMYLEQLSSLFDPPYLRGEKPRVDRKQAEQYGQIPQVIERFGPVIERNLLLSADNAFYRSHWQYLSIHAEFCVAYAAMLAAAAAGDEAAAKKKLEELQLFVQEREDAIQPVFDVFTFVFTLNHRMFTPVFS